MLIGKNKEQFKRYYLDNMRFAENRTLPFYSFIELPFEMQIGVYLAYYDSLGLTIELQKNWTVGIWHFTIADKIGAIVSRDYQSNGKSRNEAYKEAFKKADEIINETYK